MDKCLSDYDKAIYPPPTEYMFFSSVVALILGIISGLVLSLIVISTVNKYVVDLYKTLFYTSFIITSVPWILLIIVAYYTDYWVKKDELLGNYRKIDFVSNYFFWFVLLSNIFIILIYFINIITTPVKNYTDLFSILIMFIFSIFIVRYFKLNTLDRLKSELTRKYAKKFPKVLVTTNVGEVSGRICNIFNDNVILLDDDGCKVAVEWNHIILLRIIDINTYNV